MPFRLGAPSAELLAILAMWKVVATVLLGAQAALMEQALIENSASALSGASHYSKLSRDQAPDVRWLVLSIQAIIKKKLLWAFLRYVSGLEDSLLTRV